MTNSVNQNLRLRLATPSDAPNIAQIHMTSFASDPVLLAAFPTPEIRESLGHCLLTRTTTEIQSPKMTVLVVCSIEPGLDAVEHLGGKVIAYAKYAHPVEEEEDDVATHPTFPPGTVQEVLQRYRKSLENAQENAIGETPCYRLNFMGTDPKYRRQGAATLMLNWGIENARQSGHPIYLESTLDAAPVYEKMGFVLEDRIPVDLGMAENGESLGAYEELSFVYYPSQTISR